MEEVRSYAKANQVTAVFKRDTEPPNLDVPESVVRTINKSVIYCEDGLDITPIILKRLNDKNPK